MPEKAPVFEKIYRDYLDRVSGLDLSGKEDVLGVRRSDEGISVSLFNREFSITRRGVFGPGGREPGHSVIVLLCRYLIACPESVPEKGDWWVSYRDFRDAAPFAGAFANNAEKKTARNFEGATAALENACRQLGGFPPDGDLSYDLVMKVFGLPRVPLLLLFNDADEEFGAECSILFEKRAELFLDMECLAILGWLFSDYLAGIAGRGRETLI